MKEKLLESVELWNDENGQPISASDLFLIIEVVVDTIDGMETMDSAIKGDEKKGLMNG